MCPVAKENTKQSKKDLMYPWPDVAARIRRGSHGGELDILWLK